MESIRKTLMIPKDIIDRVEEYQKDNYLASFTAAVVGLIIKGLEEDKNE